MNTHELAHKLLPTTNCPMDDKWRAAWALLDELPDVPIEHRCHARCWLTYRAIEGHVTREEYERRVWKACEIPAGHERAPRWVTSQAAAEFYLWTLWDERERGLDAGTDLMNGQIDYPPAILSYLRMMAVEIYREYLDGQRGAAKSAIAEAVSQWRDAMSNLDWQKYPLRFLDGRGDMTALHSMMCIADKMGMLPYPVETGTVQNTKGPWVECLKSFFRKKGAIWFPSPSSRVGLGALVPHFGVVAELGVARGEFSAALLKHHPHIGGLYAIDKWDDDRHPQNEECIARENLSDDRAFVMRRTFEDAVAGSELSEIEFDLIYIDGYAHTGQDGGKTLDDWWPKLKDGGIFAGHDYDPAWPLTIQAVDAFASKHGLQIRTIQEKPYASWWAIKTAP